MRSLFKYTGFLPYLLIVFLNAMTDLGHKIVIQNTVFKSYDGFEQIIFTAIVNALILLPFVMLFTPSGFLADKYPKDKIIKFSACFAVVIAIFITISYHIGAFWLSFFLTFVLAAQSAIYSPAKYGYIKELVGKDNLSGANAVVQAITIVAILAGVLIYSLIFENLLADATKDANAILQHIKPIGYILIAATLIEAFLSFKLVQKKETDHKLSFNTTEYIKAITLRKNLRSVTKKESIWLSVLGLSIFWSVSQVVFAIFGSFLEESAGVTNTVVAQGLMALGGLGIVMGSMYYGKISKNYIETGIIPLGAIGMALALFLLPSSTQAWMFGALFFAFGFFGGVFIVPLNALIQFNAKEEELGTVLAANNFVQNIFMLAFLLFTILWAHYELSSESLFLLLGIFTLVGSAYTIYKLPQLLIRFVAYRFFSLFFRIDVQNLHHLPSDGGVLLLGNHISWLDWAVVQIASPRRVRFVMERSIYEKWYLKIFLDFFGVIPVSARASKDSFKRIESYLEKGEVVCLFPEGSISRNGHLGEFKGGFERLNKELDYCIVPFFIRGLWGSKFSYASPKVQADTKAGLLRDVTFSFGKSLDKTTTAITLKEAIVRLSVDAWDMHIQNQKPLANLWLHKAKVLGQELSIADSSGVKLSHHKLLTSVLCFQTLLKPKLHAQQNVGIILPASAANAIANLSVLSLGKTMVNLNYTVGLDALSFAISDAEVKTVITSEKFLQKLKAKGFDISQALKNVNILLMEELKKEIHPSHFLIKFLVSKLMPTSLIELFYFKRVSLEDTAAILFSSGSEGKPKGIMLSHKNIVGNIKQSTSVLNPTNEDVVVGSLPPFHSFGLTITTLLPLVEGIKVVCHPDPTDGAGLGKLVAKYEATFLCATSTFLRFYIKNKKLHPLMFASLRLVVAGAEKLNPDVRAEFKEKFGLDVFEGYGATETTPVAGINIPDVLCLSDYRVQKGTKIGSIGLALPGTIFKIVEPQSMKELAVGEEGLILIGGTQIMQGYLNNPQKTNEALYEQDGLRWYKTGDKGKLDSDGFLTIVDRYSRFAKVAGEMVSLGKIESLIAELFGQGDYEVAATAIKDAKKGEKVILLLRGNIDALTIKEKMLSSAVSNLLIPSAFYTVEAIPKLGSGKSDFSKIKQLAQELAS